MDVGALVQAYGPLITAGCSIGAIFFTVRMGWRMKIADVLMECHRRYDAVADKGCRLTTNSDPRDTYQYYEKFWSLQCDQFAQRRRKLIDDQTYAHWMSIRQDEWEVNAYRGGLSFRAGYFLVQDRVRVPYELRELLVRVVKAPPGEMLRIVREKPKQQSTYLAPDDDTRPHVEEFGRRLEGLGVGARRLERARQGAIEAPAGAPSIEAG